MNVTLLLVAVVLFSYGVGHFVTRYASRYVVLSGAEHMLVGVLISSQVGLGLVGETTLDRIGPLFSLLLGLVGFLVGLRGRESLKRFDHATIGVVSALGVVALTAAMLLPLLVGVLPVAREAADFVVTRPLLERGEWTLELYFTSTHLWLALALGAAASVTSTLLVEGTARLYGSRGPLTALLGSAARSSQLVAVIVLGLVLAAARALDTQNRFSLTVVEWVLAAVLGGVVSGLLFGLFIGKETDSSRIFLATLGLVTFASGLGAALGISPLFVNLLAGVTVGVTSPHAPRLREELERLEHPLYVLLTLFAGTLWAPVSGWLWVLPLGYTAVRFLSRRIATRVSVAMVGHDVAHQPRLGNGLIGQGTLAVAVALDFALRVPKHAPLVLTTVLFGTLLSDLWSLRALKTLLADAGELWVAFGESPPPNDAAEATAAVGAEEGTP